MRNFMDVDGPFISGLTKMADVFILNLLVILCSIPIITIGPAVTALYYVTLKMVKDEDSYTVKSYFKSFKQNFKQGICIWLIMLIIGFVLYCDLKFMNGDFSHIVQISDSMAKVVFVFLMAAGFMYMFTISYVFPVLSRFDNSVKNTIKNSLLMSIRHFPSTLLIILIDVAPIILIYLVPKALILVFVIFGLCAYCNSFLFVKIFKIYMPEDTITSDEDFQVSMDE